MSLSYLPFFFAKLACAPLSGELIARFCPEIGERDPATMWLIIASIWYLVLTTVGSVFQAWLESRYNTNYGQAPQRSGLSRFLSFSGGKD